MVIFTDKSEELILKIGNDESKDLAWGPNYVEIPSEKMEDFLDSLSLQIHQQAFSQLTNYMLESEFRILTKREDFPDIASMLVDINATTNKEYPSLFSLISSFYTYAIKEELREFCKEHYFLDISGFITFRLYNYRRLAHLLLSLIQGGPNIMAGLYKLLYVSSNEFKEEVFIHNVEGRIVFKDKSSGDILEVVKLEDCNNSLVDYILINLCLICPQNVYISDSIHMQQDVLSAIQYALFNSKIHPMTKMQ
jgi:hypothetical protein